MSLSLVFIGYYVLTRKEYKLPNISIFIPNTNLFSGNIYTDKNYITNNIMKSIDFKFVTSPDIGWLLTFKPIYGIDIPVKMLLPWDIFIAIPQIKSEIGKNIKIEPDYIGGILIGYRIKIENAKFWA